jgi:hypothetical protein
MRVLGWNGGAVSSRQDDSETVASANLRRFQLILIKPSHYDDDGYVIRWWRSTIPSNSSTAFSGSA